MSPIIKQNKVVGDIIVYLTSLVIVVVFSVIRGYSDCKVWWDSVSTLEDNHLYRRAVAKCINCLLFQQSDTAFTFTLQYRYRPFWISTSRIHSAVQN